jgi:hypothetical protein
MPPKERSLLMTVISFITYASQGTFTLNDCHIGVSEPFSWWSLEGKCWNHTFMIVNEGAFKLVDCDFVDINIYGEICNDDNLLCYNDNDDDEFRCYVIIKIAF